MMEILMLVLISIVVVIGLFVAWLLAELRGRPVSTRISLGIATITCAIAVVWWSWAMYADGREDFDHRNFGDALASLQEALHGGKSAEVERVLHEFHPTNPRHQNASAISDLRWKLDALWIREPSATPVPKQP
jgi:4-amino-4-deoxy-L-arabinose transferase-like glycosyltransferase